MQMESNNLHVIFCKGMKNQTENVMGELILLGMNI